MSKKGRCRCKSPSAPHPRGPCNHPYRDHPKAARERDAITPRLPEERVLTVAMGGEVAALLERTRGKTLESPCGHVVQGDRWLGYPHEGGIADAQGRAWWAYVRCPECEYEAAQWKVERRIRELPAPAPAVAPEA